MAAKARPETKEEQEEDDYGAELDKKGAIDWATGSLDEIYTYLMPGEEWYELCSLVEEAVCCKNGIAKFDWEKRLVKFLEMTLSRGGTCCTVFIHLNS